MPAYRTVSVVEILGERPGLARLRVQGDGRDAPERAYALTDVTGPVAVGDQVVVNTTAVDLGLGTGGWHFVHWNLARDRWSHDGGGHIMKVRYTSLQHEMRVTEENTGEGPDPAVGERPDLGGVPVVACSLHSQVGVVAAALGHLRPGLRVAYVMTDGGALPLALSDLVVALRERGLLTSTITTGHAWGGDHEAVSIPSGLAIAADVVGAEVIVAGMGPGVVGTGSPLGFTGLDQTTVLDSAAWLGGRPVMCVRASDGDARPRHQGVSHHSLTVADATRSSVDVPLPDGQISAEQRATLALRHRLVDVAPLDVAPVLDSAGIEITTMRRGPAEDPLFFAVATAAAGHAIDLLG